MNEQCPHGLWPEACEQCLRNEVSALAARLAEAEAHIGHLCSLVEWWAPKDGVQRTADARAFLTPDSATNQENERG